MTDYYFQKLSGQKKIKKKYKNKGKNRLCNCNYHHSHRVYRKKMYPARKRQIKSLNRSICSKNNLSKFGPDYINNSFIGKDSKNLKNQCLGSPTCYRPNIKIK